MLLTARSSEKEFLDDSSLSTKDLYQNLSELDSINKLTGGYRASIRGLKLLLSKKPGIQSILDIGFGGGDSILQLNKFASKTKNKIFFYGVDLKSDCFNYAIQRLANFRNVKLLCSDYKNIQPELYEKTDVIHCSLFLHHLEESEIINLFQIARAYNCILLINDLHRNKIAYHSIKFLTRLFSNSWLVKNDATISVKRGFTKTELENMLVKSGYSNFSVKWYFAFRYIAIAIP